MADESRLETRTALVRAVGNQIDMLAAKPLAAGLYLVATPIGNLSDITLRALHVLAAADVVCAEDTRHSARLFEHYGIRRAVRSYHDHSSQDERDAIIESVRQGKSVALISDAGTPLVSDPGYKLVRDVIASGGQVSAVPGASALLAGLTCSGLPSDAFLFAGFLPPKSAQRQKRIAALADSPATLVFYEAPQRLTPCLADLATGLGDREAAVGRELTKRYEEHARGPLSEVADIFAKREVKGECVIVVAPPDPDAPVDDDAIRNELRSALATQTMRDAVREVSERLGVARKRVYDLGLAIDERT